MEEVAAWRSQEEELLALAMESTPDPNVVDLRLRELAARFGPDVFARYLHLICHVDVSPEEARSHWQAILSHTRTMAEGLKRPVDYRVGAADYFIRETPCIPYPAVIDIRIYQQTEQGILKDPLTSLYNLRYLEEVMPREIGISRRNGAPLTLIFLDVDHFKAYNDGLGHEAGNLALQAVAGVIRDSVRDMDLPCRYGGEEFTVLLPATDKLGGLAVASRIVQSVERLRLAAPSPFGVLTISGGVASFPSDAADAEELVRHADAAMYQAKALGKNRALPYSYERRGYLRIPRDFTGTAAGNGRAALPLSGKNLSCSGLYFQLPTDVAPGQILDLNLDLGQGPSAAGISCRVRVVRCEPEGDGVFGIGAQIIHIPTGDRLRYFNVASSSHPQGG